jgi:hypothetical protein
MSLNESYSSDRFNESSGASILGAGPDAGLDAGVSIAAAEPVKQAQTQSKATAKSRTRIFI